jgi:hypothetical protein
MQVSNETIRRVVLATGWKPGSPVNDDALRAWFAGMASELQAQCLAVAARYQPKYTRVSINPEDDPQHMAKMAAENCARAIQAWAGE